jgi:hypothetical protein
MLLLTDGKIPKPEFMMMMQPSLAEFGICGCLLE